MIGKYVSSVVVAARQGWSLLLRHGVAVLARRPSGRRLLSRTRRLLARRPVRYALISTAVLGVVLAAASGGLWWRLTSGPLALDMVTPWLTSAIEARFGGQHRIEVGGTQLERDENGRTALRLRDIVVRDRDGIVVASAPKAEVGISGSRLLTGHLQASRLSLIGVEMSLRVDADGQLVIFAGADKHPVATAPVPTAPTRPSGAAPRAPADAASDILASLLGWLDAVDKLGLDGRDLTEIGLKSGSIVVDDRRNGKRWTFGNINFSLTRPKEGGVAFNLSSSGTDGPWSLAATVTPRGEGNRAIEAVMRDVSPKDVLFALRMGDGAFEADMPLSGILRAEIGPDGSLQKAEGRLVAGAGFVGNTDSVKSRVLVDEVQMDWRWDPVNRVLVMPFEVSSGPNRITLLTQLEAPAQPGGVWSLAVNRGMIVLGPNERTRDGPLVLDRVMVRGHVDVARRRIEIKQAELRGLSTGVSFSANIDYSDGDPRIDFGLAATRMSVGAFKRLWPVFAAPDVRAWVQEHVLSGTVERVVLAVNAPLSAMRPGGPPMPEDGLSIEIKGAATLRPIQTLPAIRDVDLNLNVTGRTVTLQASHGALDLPSGRKLNLSNAVFDVADTHRKPSQARLRMRVDGAVDAVAELAAIEPLRSNTGVVLDPASVRGTIAAQLTLGFPLHKDAASELTYNVEGDVTNFAADKLVRGQRVEAQTLRVNVNPERFQVKGEARIGSTMVNLDYRKPKGDADAEARAQMVLDDGARRRLGFDLGGAVTGPVTIKFGGRIASYDGGANRFAVDADLTQTQIADLLPGWRKASGKPARATFILIERDGARRFEDMVLEGSGTLVRGSLDLDATGEIVGANFPVFTFTDSDKASLKVDRGNDGTLRVVLRGDVFDGHGFIKSLTGVDAKAAQPASDVDLELKLGAVAGFNGEAIRGLELRMSRRAGEIRSLSLNARLGRDAPLTADLRSGGRGRPIVYIDSGDAGALLRFSDLYPRMFGGRMTVQMDPPTADRAPSNGVFTINSFIIRGEAALDRVAASGPADPGNTNAGRSHGVEFSRMRMDFTRSPGKLSVREGVVWGPAVGATMDGSIDFAREDVRLRGTFVPAYALNNILPRMFAPVPVLGDVLGGANAGLVGVTYEVVGPPNGMMLRVNPVSAVMPGILKKLFEFRGPDERAFVPNEQPYR